jgi:transposase-like protein
MSNFKNITCPRCSSPELYKFGKDPDSGKQKFQCKKCRAQFVPGKSPKRKIYPYPQPLCPKCGARMGIFKHLSDATRFRCSNHNKSGKQKCSFKLNMPLGTNKTFKLITKVENIELISDKINPIFHWNKMKFPPMVVALAMYLAICEGNAATQVSKIMRNLYNIKISHDTITRWHHKAAFLLSAKTRHLPDIPQKPGRKPRLYADETELNGGKEKRWFWMSYCRKYDLMLGRNLTKHRDTKSARNLIAMTHELAPTLKASDLLTDGLWSYPAAMGDLDIKDDKHIRYISFFSKPNNNSLERKWSNFKNKARVYRGIKSDLGKMAYIEGQIFYHNCVKPSVYLGNKTPYENLNVKLPKHNSEVQLIYKLLTK